MRKFAVAQAFLYYLENYRKKKPTVASFQLTTRNLKLLFYFLHCRFFIHLNMCNAVSLTFIWKTNSSLSGHLSLFSLLKSTFRFLGS